MESVEQSSLNTNHNQTNTAVHLILQSHQDICNNNNNNNNNNSNNNKMVSSTLIKHEITGSFMPSALATVTTTPPPPPAAAAAVTVNIGQAQIMNVNKCQQIVNKSSQQQQQQQQLNNINGSVNTINSPKMGSRRIFTPQFKLQVLESYRNDNDCKGNQRATARKYNIHRRQIQKWLQCESNLRSSVANINQSQVKHQFHNITPCTTTTPTVATTTPSNNNNNNNNNNNQFVSQQQQHYSGQNINCTVPSAVTTATTTPCTAAGVLVAANFAAVVAAAASASMVNVDKHGTSITATTSPIRPTAIVGGGNGNGDDGGGGGGGVLHPHAHLTHLSHHSHALPPPHHHHHHHHHHMHPHGHHHNHNHHHHHGYSTLPYPHTAVPILTHHQSMYPHPAAAALLAAAHHHIPSHQLHSHHYEQQQQQQEYHALQQQQQQQQQIYAAATAVTSVATEKEPLEVEVVGDVDTESETEMETVYKQHENNCNKNTIILQSTAAAAAGNSIDYEREQKDIVENDNNSNCGRVRLTAVYKLQQQNDEEIEKPVKENLDIEQAAITPIDLSLATSRRHNNNNGNKNLNSKINNIHKMMTIQDNQVIYATDDDDNSNYNNNNNNNNTAMVVDLTFRKRKVTSKATTVITAKNSNNHNNDVDHENYDDDDDVVNHDYYYDDDDTLSHPEKMPKFSAHQSTSSKNLSTTEEPDQKVAIEIKQEQITLHDVNAATINSVQNVAAKPVKLFKPYLLHDEDEEHHDEEKFQIAANKTNTNIWSQQQQLPLAPLPLTVSPYIPTTSDLFQGGNNNDKYTFPIGGSPYFQSNNASPKSLLCSPTSPIAFQRCTKGSPVSGYESSSSTYSECSSYRGLSHCTLDLQLRTVYNEQLGSSIHLQNYIGGNIQQQQQQQQQQKQQQQQLAHQGQQQQHEQHVQRWLDQDTQSSLATSSNRSSPTPTITPTTTPTPMPPTKTTPPAANTSIALYA